MQMLYFWCLIFCILSGKVPEPDLEFENYTKIDTLFQKNFITFLNKFSTKNHGMQQLMLNHKKKLKRRVNLIFAVTSASQL